MPTQSRHEDDVAGVVDRLVAVRAPPAGEVAVVAPGDGGVLGEVLGDAGIHARSAVGVAELPLGSPVEVELIVEVR